MEKTISINWADLHLIILLIVCAVIPTSSANQVYLTSYCPNTTTFAPHSQYHTNLNTLLASLSSNAAGNPDGFYSRSIGDGTNDTVYGLFLCRGDLDTRSCSDCVKTATLELLRKYCPNTAVAITWYDRGMVRYSKEDFFGTLEVAPALHSSRGEDITGDDVNMTEFMETFGKLMWNVSSQAALGGSEKKLSMMSYHYSSWLTLYTLGQCTPKLSQYDCDECLSPASHIVDIRLRAEASVAVATFYGGDAIYAFDLCKAAAPPVIKFKLGGRLERGKHAGISSWCPPGQSISICEDCVRVAMDQLPSSTTGIVKRPACTVRYDTPINNDTQHNTSINNYIPNLSAPPPLSPATDFGDSNRKKKVAAVSVSISLSLFIIVFLGFCIWMRMLKNNAKKIANLDIEEIRTMESLRFDLHTIKMATQNFSRDNKLGQGGFGEVYKGVLEGGEEIAVKRLSKNSRQGDVEFKTEVLLVDKLQHKNLVKLLGFCFESNEKILIYEYLQNSSLDKILFDSTKNPSLNWQRRFEIIVGIARGLMYLHEDSRLKIIHRDLKPSNILLDRSMIPKISDFGMARLLGVDETQGNTKRIVGTYGYMAPEYAMTGHFSVKSDVYSFGVILLEIVSGKKNRFFGRPLSEEALLHRAWRLWNEKNALHLVDTTLGENYPRGEVTKCIHLSLLCIQENAAERPRMSTIVAALNGQSIGLPMPKAPTFFGHTSAATDVASVQYRALIVGSEIQYHLDEQRVYSGTEEITELIPR